MDTKPSTEAVQKFIAAFQKLYEAKGVRVMDSKYGQLYTTDDMIAFARIVVESNLNREDLEDGVDELLDHFEGRFPKDEPLFLLRGQDRRALNAVRNYRTMTAYSGSTEPSAEFLAGLDATVVHFEDFKEDYPDRIKDAD